MGFTYDDSITLPNNKTGIEPAPPAAGIGPSDVNLICNAVTDLKTSLRAMGLRGPAWFNITEPEYGADPTGQRDSLAAWNLAYAAAIAAGGGVIIIPAGFYRFSGQALLGYRFVHESDVTAAALGGNDYTSAPSYDAGLHTQAVALPRVSVMGLGRVYWWANYTAASESAALFYGLGSQDDQYANISESLIEGITFVGPDGFNSAGVLQNPSTSTPPTTNVSGLFVPGANLLVQRCAARELKRGLVFASAYWSDIRKCAARHCVGGMDFLNHNSATADGVRADYCSTGFTASGQGVSLRRLATEECGVDLYVSNCDQLSVDGTYFESVGASLTDYGLKLGDGTNGAYFISISNSHMSREHGKTAILKGAQVTAVNTRWYDFGSNAKRMLLNDSGCVFQAFGTPIPINSASYGNNPTVQAVNWLRTGIVFLFQDTVAANASVTRTLSVTGARVGDPVVACLDTLPSGWSVSAQVVADDSVRVTAINATGGTADLGTMTGYLQVQQNKYLGT